MTALGQRQAHALATRIARQWDPDAIFASPLQRCALTAAAIAQPSDLSPQPVDTLIDRDYGDWQGLEHAEVASRWPQLWQTWCANPETTAIPNAETLIDVSTRVVRAFDRIMTAEHGKTVVLVTHDCINRLLLLHAFALPLTAYHRIAQSPCALNVLTLAEDGFKLITLNETGHLIDL